MNERRVFLASEDIEVGDLVQLADSEHYVVRGVKGQAIGYAINSATAGRHINVERMRPGQLRSQIRKQAQTALAQLGETVAALEQIAGAVVGEPDDAASPAPPQPRNPADGLPRD